MPFYADIHIHSKYSRATSRDCDLEHLSFWAQKKGISVLGTGDFTHPAWMAEIREKLIPAEPGLFRLHTDCIQKNIEDLPLACRGQDPTRFMLSVEISTIYKKGERTRKVHHVICVPDMEKAERLGARLERIGNIRSDGRPILGLDSRHLLEIVLECGEGCFLIPAHIWTPWFSVLGSKSGFDSIEECYGDLSNHIFALETGLSSDPEMNWRVSRLDRYRLVSNSDAHSPAKLGREANCFDGEMDYFSMMRALKTGEGYRGTVEFFPEEGKYHMDGHRKCGVCLEPGESLKDDGRCPVCGKPLTLGVMNRVIELADRDGATRPETANDFSSLIPLQEIIAETLGQGPATKGVQQGYEGLLTRLGPELFILNEAPLEEIGRESSLIGEAVGRMRRGEVIRQPGYDGEYGVIRLFQEEELRRPAAVGFLFEPEPERPTNPSTPPDRSGQAAKPFDSLRSLRAGRQTRKKKTPTSLLAALDPEQRRAVETAEGPVLIVAGPGSGKTRTLTCRLAWLVEEKKVAPEKLLTITFTRRAASEMQERLKILLPACWKKIPVMTFHALGLMIIRENRGALGLPDDFRLACDEERRELLMEGLSVSDKKARQFLKEISLYKRCGESPGGSDKFSEALGAYERGCLANGWVDFDDLIRFPLRLSDGDTGAITRYQKKYHYLSIDEYQDIDALQYELVKRLVGEEGRIFAIGDPDQAIYGFRGSDVGFFLRFKKDFKGAREVPLTRNYRSQGLIVEGSRQMIRSSTLLKGHRWDSFHAPEDRIVIHRAVTERAEAEFIVHSIEGMIGGSSFFALDSGRSAGDGDISFGFGDFAVLYRTEAQADPIEEALARSGIPFQRHSHNRLYEQPLVPDVVRRAQGMAGPVYERVGETLAEYPTLPQAVKQELVEIAKRFKDDWGGFLSHLYLGQDIDLLDERADRVALLTLHAAKGLEFPCVFVTGCEDGVLPLKWGAKLSKAELAEERRLFYVGMTRAEKKLFLTHATKRRWQGKVREQKVSPFINAIEEEMLKFEKTEFVKRRKREDGEQMNLF